MKKRILIIIALFTVMFTVISCVNNPPVDNSETSAPDETRFDVAANDTTAETQTGDDAPEDALSINTDLFEEYGMTFGQLKEKHGMLVGYNAGSTFDGGCFYEFENGYGTYNFNTVDNADAYITDTEGGFDYAPIGDEESVCRRIYNISAADLFSRSFEALSIDEIAAIEGIELVYTADEAGNVYSLFTYNGWSNKAVRLKIYHKAEDSIDASDTAIIYISSIYTPFDSSEITVLPMDPPELTEASINTDLFEEYGMTFGQLKEKHGKLVGYQTISGGPHYLLENGYGYYWFREDITTDFVMDPEGGFYYFPIEDDEICRGIQTISPKDLFNESFEALSIETIAGIEGIEHIETSYDGIVTPRAFASTFTYSGWNNDKVTLTIYHEDEGMIDITSEARIFIHPLDLDNANSDEAE